MRALGIGSPIFKLNYAWIRYVVGHVYLREGVELGESRWEGGEEGRGLGLHVVGSTSSSRQDVESQALL